MSEPGESPILRELLWVHDWLRRDLRRCQELADQLRDGVPATQVRGGIRALRAAGPLWQLRTDCLQYCKLVHNHHGGEDTLLFPALRRCDPALAPVLDKLQADHQQISGLLRQIATMAEALPQRDSQADRTRLIAMLRQLSDDLLEHLEIEEESIAPALQRTPHLLL